MENSFIATGYEDYIENLITLDVMKIEQKEFERKNSRDDGVVEVTKDVMQKICINNGMYPYEVGALPKSKLDLTSIIDRVGKTTFIVKPIFTFAKVKFGGTERYTKLASYVVVGYII